MSRSPPSRSLGDLTFPEVSRYLKETSILCLPIGAIEQHGPHLPLNTDVVIAEQLTRRIVARWGDDLDLWQLPTVALGLSREHDWAPGTMSLTLESFIGLVEDIAHEIVRSLPARNLLIVNGHGGNRGVLENLIRELRGDCGLNACVIHPFDLSKAEPDAAGLDVHGGKSETSVMLALAPDLVRRGEIGRPKQSPDPKTRSDIEALVLDRGTTLALAHRRSAACRPRRDRRRARGVARARGEDRRKRGRGSTPRARTAAGKPTAGRRRRQSAHAVRRPQYASSAATAPASVASTHQ